MAAMEGLGDGALGHVSVREPGTDRFWMKAANVGLEEIGVEQLVLVDFEGNKLAGDLPRHGEFPLHAEVLRRRPEVNSVVHVHPLYTTVFSALDEPLRPITHEGALFVPPPPRFTEMTDLILTREQGEMVVDVMGARDAVIMRNHGILVAGATVQEACLKSIFLEKAAKAQLLLAGRMDYEWTSDEEAVSKVEHIYNPRLMGYFWGYHVRKLERQERLAGLSF
jgi:L-fuculose-phosphate aldolase